LFKKEALLKFLGSRLSKTEEQILLPNPEIYTPFYPAILKISFVLWFL
jgi:hypothetical protein